MEFTFKEQKFRETIWGKLIVFLAKDGQYAVHDSLARDEKFDLTEYEQWLSWMEQRWTIRFTFENADIQGNVESVEIEDEHYTLLLLKYQE